MPGSVAFPGELLGGLLLLLARLGAWLAFVPLPGLSRAPARLRAALAVALTLLMLPAAPAARLASGADLLAGVLGEILWGLSCGAATALLFEAFQLGAQIAGLQAGFSFASTIDPTSQADSAVLGVWMTLLVGSAACAAGLDRELLRALAGSVGAPRGPLEAALLGQLAARMFTTGLALALPVIAVLLVVDLALALVSRYQPNLPLLSLAFPVKMLGSLWLLGLLTPQLLRLFSQAWPGTLAALRGMAAP